MAAHDVVGLCVSVACGMVSLLVLLWIGSAVRDFRQAEQELREAVQRYTEEENT